MGLENTAIEDRLHSEGYKTTRINGIVNVLDPIHQAVAGSNQLVVAGWNLIEIRSSNDAWTFIEERR